MSEKCFCHFNGYVVKDAAARAGVEEAKAEARDLIFRKRRYILIADSYGDYSPIGWTGIFKQTLNLSDEDCILAHMGSTGFIGNIDTTFQDLLENANASNPETITDIVVAGGYNDQNYTPANVATAIDAFCAKAKELYPNAKIHIGMIATSRDGALRDKIVNNSLYAYSGTLCNGDYAYMANVENVLRSDMTAYMRTDNIHPSEDGYRAIARAIIHAVNGGFVSGHRSFFLSINAASGVSISNSNIKMFISNDNAKIDLARITISKADGFSSDSWVDIGTFDYPLAGNNPYMQTPFVGYGRNASGFVNVFGTAVIADNHLYLKIRNIDGGGFISGVTMVDLTGVTWNVPAVLY